ncbi:hypothetical protein RclHR1_21560006 [Rhizophagus clarus]|uniref:DNA-directed DNA polymerase n=1 Tax=Rhizophagus clarus TaxID=94130 RepID=A0A2Z6QSH5_9GLOM|nr:hypothetical protein RclHR1_21560006 [Rhizophagus clarus]
MTDTSYTKIDEMERNTHSGWIYDYGIKVYLKISAYQPLRGSSHFEIPNPWNNPQFGIINPKNNDEFCFHECIKAHCRSDAFRRGGEENLTDRHNINDNPEGFNTHYCLINGEALLKAPFVIYPDNECDSNKLDEKEEDKNKNTVKIQKQKNGKLSRGNMQEDLEMIKEILRNFAELKMTAQDWEKHNSRRKCYLCDGLLQEVRYNKAKYFDNETQKFNEHLSKKEEKAFNEATKCVICKGNLKEEKINKVRDHDHITEKYREAAHREYPIADNMESYKSFTIGQFKFIDTIQFHLPSLEKIATNLHGRKDEYPYELNDPDRFSRTKLPSREEFNTVLGGLNYCEQGCKKCNHEIKGTRKNIYYKQKTVRPRTENAFQNFRTVMIDVFELDPANYITLPLYAFDVMKKVTKVKLELFHKGQGDMHEFVHQRMMRSGNSMASCQIAKTNFSGMKGYDKKPKRGSAWEVKLRYLDKLHLSHSDFPLCPERRIVKREELNPYQNTLIEKLSNDKFVETEKLVATLEIKDRYILHYSNLQQCLALGMELEHVYQLMNNAVFGKTMEDVRRHKRIDLIRPIGKEH